MCCSAQCRYSAAGRRHPALPAQAACNSRSPASDPPDLKCCQTQDFGYYMHPALPAQAACNSRHPASDNTSNQAGQKQDFGYYMQLAQAAQDAVGHQQSIGTGLNSTLQGINAQQQAGIAQAGQQAQSGALGRMGAMGLDGGQLAALGATTAQQQG